MLQSLIQEITIRSQTINLEVRLATLPVILESRSAGAGTANSCGGRIRVKAPVDVPSVRVSIPAELKRTGQETRLLVHWALDIEARKPDRSLLRLLGQARQFGMMVMDGQGRSVRKLAAEAGVSPSYFTRLFRLQFLAPEIVQAILPGEQPPGLTANRLKLAGTLACAWSEQRRQLGFD